MNQEKALAILKSGRNVFITGSAGTGKTYVLNKYISYLQARKVPTAITASTGIAATHMNGQTIHSWSGMGVKEELSYHDLLALKDRSYLVKNLTKVKVLILDEISMLHRKQVDMLNDILKYFNENEEPFGGIQVVFSGDFFQLPPVTKNEETNRQKFAFMAPAWVEAKLHVCYLTQQFRQTDNELNLLLNEIRTGEVSAESKSILDEAVYTKFKTTPTRLYSHNYDVDRVNGEELETIAGENEVFSAEIKGRDGLKEMLAKQVLAPENLALKENARVMFVKNNFEKGYMNGTLGTVVGFSGENSYPLIQLDSGRTIEAEPEVWSIEDESGKTLASYSQVPLRLAWAITVHKSQGMTLDSAEVDLTKTFEKGQGYVALSRLKDLEGLRLLGYNEVALEVDELALKADKRFAELSDAVDKALETSVLEKNHNAFVLACGGLIDQRQIKKLAEKRKLKKSKKSTFQLTEELYETGLSIQKIAEERVLTTNTIVSHLVRLKREGKNMDFTRIQKDIASVDVLKTAYEALLAKNKPEHFLDNGYMSSKALFDKCKGRFDFETIHLFLLAFEEVVVPEG
ncbi:MAG: ATP-dependent exoDNAse (exonuclease V) alpha subunit [Bacteroidia bacterium]|jgi:ATP-dependent exoDNAse (exonuclease V) alpha subunit